jgi:hypothetical protein
MRINYLFNYDFLLPSAAWFFAVAKDLLRRTTTQNSER